MISAILCVLSWGVFGGGYGLAYLSRINALDYYDANYISFCSAIVNKGTASEPDSDGFTTYTYTFTDANQNDFSASVSDDAHQLGEMKFVIDYTSSDNHDVQLTFVQRSLTLSFNFADISIGSDTSVIMGRGIIDEEGVYKVSRVIFGTVIFGDGEVNSNEALEARFAEYQSTLEVDYRALAVAIGYTGNENFKEMMALQGKGHTEQLKVSTAGDIMLLVGSILGSAFVFSTLLLGILSFHERKKRKLPTLQENPIASVPYENVKPLKKN